MAFKSLKIIGDGTVQNGTVNTNNIESVINSIIAYNNSTEDREFKIFLDGDLILLEKVQANSDLKISEKINIPANTTMTVQSDELVNISLFYYEQAIDTDAALSYIQEMTAIVKADADRAELAVPTGSINDGEIRSDRVWSSANINDKLGTKVDNSQVLTDVPLNAVFTDTTYEIIDTLVSTDITKPLSANQGKILNESIQNLSSVISSTDTDLDTIQEIVDYIKLNKSSLESLNISAIAGLQTALDNKVDNSQVLTDVPLNAVFTDTTYSSSDFWHQNLSGYNADEHIDWTLPNIKNIHPDNYINTVYDDTAIQSEVDLNTAKRTYPESDEAKLALISATVAINLDNIEDNATADQTKEDIDSLGINAATVNNFSIGTNVPSDALFTDTTYRYINKTGSYTAENLDFLFCDTTLGIFEITLPLAPSIGTKVVIFDIATSFATNNLTVLRNGKTIMGAETDKILDVDDKATTFIYVGNNDWRLI